MHTTKNPRIIVNDDSFPENSHFWGWRRKTTFLIFAKKRK